MAKYIVPCILLSASLNAIAADVSGWREIATGPESMCADGTPFRFYIRNGTAGSGKVIFDFMGGGACWDARTCAADSMLYQRTMPDVLGQWIPEADGLYHHDRIDNPLADATHVLIPYCTGDIHWGHSDTVYKSAKGKSIDVRHRGAVNAQAAIDGALSELKEEISDVYVTGCSAGAYASIWWTPYIHRQLPLSRVSQFSDSGAGILTDSFRKQGFSNWRIEKSAPSWVPGLDPLEHDLTQLPMDVVYRNIARHYPTATFSQFNHLNDLIQRYFYRIMGGDPYQWSFAMQKSALAISSQTDNFTYYTNPWDGHCILASSDFYESRPSASKSETFAKWFGSLTRHEMPASEPCEGCEIDSP